MQFVNKGWKLLFGFLIFIHILDLGYSTRIEMNAGDKKICLGCLNIIKILRNVKSSSICERISQTSFNYVVGVDINALPQNELMCYEIYYYFYFFKPSYLSDIGINILNSPESYMEMLADSVNNPEQSDCNVCAYLDKCEYYGCANQLASKGREIEPRNEKRFLFDKEKMMEVIKDRNKTNVIEPRNEIDLVRSQEKNIKNIGLGGGIDSNFNSHAVKENKTSNIVQKNYPAADIAFLSKSVRSSKPGETRTSINSRQDIKTVNILNEHFDLTRVKIEHMLDELYNLANIHRSIQEIKKKALNNLISRKVQIKLPSDVELVPLRILNTDNLRNYLRDIKIISEKFHTIFEATQLQIVDNMNKYFSETDVNNLNKVHSKKIDISMEYLLSFSNCYNELFQLGNSIYESNTNTVESIQKLFPQREIDLSPRILQKINVHNESVGFEVNQLKTLKNNEDEKNFLEKNNLIKNINFDVDEKKFLEKNNLIKNIKINVDEKKFMENNEKRENISSDKENSSLMLNITKFSGNPVNINNTEDNGKEKKESKDEKMKISNDTKIVLLNLQNKTDDIKNSNFTTFEKKNIVKVSSDVKYIAATEKLTKNNETYYLVERLQKLEKEQERFNIFLKNSSLLDAYNGKNFKQPIAKQEIDEEGNFDDDDDETFEDENEENFDDRKNINSNYYLKPTRRYTMHQNNKENYLNLKRTRTEIGKNNHHSRTNYKKTTSEDEINKIYLNSNENNEIRNKNERKLFAKKILRKNFSRKS